MTMLNLIIVNTKKCCMYNNFSNFEVTFFGKILLNSIRTKNKMLKKQGSPRSPSSF